MGTSRAYYVRAPKHNGAVTYAYTDYANTMVLSLSIESSRM